MSFFRSVAVLVSGTALGHGITAGALPILSRLYTPADFSLLAVFAGLVSIISVAACLRFDVAVALPAHDSEALTVLCLALGLALATSASLGALVLLAPQWITSWLNQPGLQPYLWLLPIAVLVAGGYSALQMWFVRQKKFPLIARSRVGQSIGAVTTQAAGGVLALGPVGLLLGHVMNSGVACTFLGYRLFKEIQHHTAVRTLTWRSIRDTWRVYERFPKYSTLEAISNNAAIHLPVIMIAALAAPAEAGYLMMATYVMQAPMALIGTSVGQVYLSQAVHEHRQNALGPFTANVLAGLIKSGVGPLLAVGIVSPAAFGPVFGNGWERAGVLVAWMTPWFILQFLATPLSMGLHVTGHQRLALLIQFAGLLLRLGFVWAASVWTPAAISESYALSGFLFYGLYLWVIVRCTGAVNRKMLEIFSRSLAPIFLWGAMGGVFHLLLAWATR
jgi:O-antigen/teichoic acid export membrane protein